MNSNSADWDSHYKRVKNNVTFEKFRDHYDEKSPYMKRMVKFAKGKKRSLEFGSGKGGLSLILKRQYPEIDVHLLDLEEDAVEFSKHLFKYYNLEANFHIDDFLKMPFQDNYFDFVHGNTALEHVQDTRKAVKEITRITDKDGIILVTVPNWYRRFDGHDVYHTINRFNYYSRTFKPKELEKIFVENSCEVLDRFGTGCVYFYPSYIPRYIYEKMNNEKKNSLKDGNSSCDLKEKKSVDEKKEKSIYSNKERTMYRSGFMYLDKAWDPIQKRINRLISTKSLMPASWYITFGLVVQKKK